MVESQVGVGIRPTRVRDCRQMNNYFRFMNLERFLERIKVSGVFDKNFDIRGVETSEAILDKCGVKGPLFGGVFLTIKSAEAVHV